MVSLSKLFCVVQFSKDSSVEFVPKKWISQKEEKYYVKFPRLKNQRLLKLQRDSESEPVEAWPEWEVTLIKSSDKADKVDKKAQEYTVDSDIESSEQESSSNQKRKKTGHQEMGVPVAPSTSYFGLNQGGSFSSSGNSSSTAKGLGLVQLAGVSDGQQETGLPGLGTGLPKFALLSPGTEESNAGPSSDRHRVTYRIT